ncbi:hypothetical protein B723_05110 [Pseudomonas fluorescens NCIMB 11764]|uniref:Uncharacterized protein n=1 Tax=Pseudomonas fluorescens NCIMB 11764 TaxID=1221522 RepID=A0A0K1QJC3_PSEFL|nr:hypothetical protein B723_05110 [Pseudomonas fluorescens NCIMB 11764]
MHRHSEVEPRLFIFLAHLTNLTITQPYMIQAVTAVKLGCGNSCTRKALAANQNETAIAEIFRM